MTHIERSKSFWIILNAVLQPAAVVTPAGFNALIITLTACSTTLDIVVAFCHAAVLGRVLARCDGKLS